VAAGKDGSVDEAGRGGDLWALADLVTAMAVRVAATLRIADHLAAGPRTGRQLAALARVDADALERVLRHLAATGVLARDGSGGYGLTALGEPLRDDHQAGLRARLDLTGPLGRADLSFACLPHSVATGQAAFPRMFGRSFWDDLAADGPRTASYDRLMGADVAGWARMIVPAYDWSSLGHLVDVGGGNGTLLAALLAAHPTLRGTVVDQPATAAAARETLRASGVGERGGVASGSFFDPLPRGAGGYLLCAILHDWDDSSAAAILRRCAEAARDHGGTVLIVEKVGADGESPNTEMDLRMLAYFGGKERGVTQLRTLAAHSGLDVAAVHPAGTLTIIECHPATERHRE
jgi:hypothetical protein